ncbi:hypothetical protein Geu3261_0196_001 [Komagataeibacter europaeus NBRC 3261]|uniref:Transposase n=1 Tax=Komagataeibacter europaeus NBRC 3261 TaxID=1234669 RepID=A0A0D6Q1R5_KOMEU|nr:hypothetical protein Geu3261_0196_001 [Komagataeibacter europaeus NBRC 3261]
MPQRQQSRASHLLAAEESDCSPHTLNKWVKKAEVETGKRATVPTKIADRPKALEREVRGLRQGVIRGKPKRAMIKDRSAPCPLDKVN